MPSFDIIKEVKPEESFRVSGVLNIFDIPSTHIKEQFKGNIDIEGKKWNIGLIVGSSGTGKTTIMKELFKNASNENYEYKASSVIDDMPKNKGLKEITKVFTNVGFSSPPSWLKPYNVLSNGEKMRTDLARAILEEDELIVFDEFTSVVDRTVAKTGSLAINKAIRKMDKKFVAVSCHSDIIEWLEPDWIYFTDTQNFFFIPMRNELQDPKLKLTYTKLINLLKREYGKYLGNITI